MDLDIKEPEKIQLKLMDKKFTSEDTTSQYNLSTICKKSLACIQK